MTRAYYEFPYENHDDEEPRPGRVLGAVGVIAIWGLVLLVVLFLLATRYLPGQQTSHTRVAAESAGSLGGDEASGVGEKPAAAKTSIPDTDVYTLGKLRYLSQNLMNITEGMVGKYGPLQPKIKARDPYMLTSLSSADRRLGEIDVELSALSEKAGKSEVGKKAIGELSLSISLYRQAINDTLVYYRNKRPSQLQKAAADLEAARIHRDSGLELLGSRPQSPSSPATRSLSH